MDFQEGDFLRIKQPHAMLEVDGSTLVFERMDTEGRGRGYGHYLIPHTRYGNETVYFLLDYVEKL